MGNAVTALFLAAGVAALAYAKLGKRIGYSNGSTVWSMVAISFGITFIVAIIIFSNFISLNN